MKPKILQEIDTLGQQINNFAPHLTKQISKIVTVVEPFAQLTPTTVTLGFKPKSVSIEACITNKDYISIGHVDETGAMANTHFHVINKTWIRSGEAIKFENTSSNYIVGNIVITNDGFVINWSYVGTLPNLTTENRQLVISATTH